MTRRGTFAGASPPPRHRSCSTESFGPSEDGWKDSHGHGELNEVSAEQLQTLPGIGPKLVERIMASRPHQKLDGLVHDFAKVRFFRV